MESSSGYLLNLIGFIQLREKALGTQCMQLFFSSTAGHGCSINATDKKLEDFLARYEFYNRPLSKVHCTKLNMVGQSTRSWMTLHYGQSTWGF